MIFGRVTCGNTAGVLTRAGRLFAEYHLNEDINLLYFDLDRPENQIRQFFIQREIDNISAYIGGNNQMWRMLRNVGITDRVILPVVVGIDTTTTNSTGHTADNCFCGASVYLSAGQTCRTGRIDVLGW